MDSLHRTVQQLRSELGRYKHRAHKAEQQVAKVCVCVWRKVGGREGERKVEGGREGERKVEGGREGGREEGEEREGDERREEGRDSLYTTLVTLCVHLCLLQTQEEKESEKPPSTSEVGTKAEAGSEGAGGEKERSQDVQELHEKVKTLTEEKRAMEAQLEAFRQAGKDEREKAEILAAEKKYRAQVCY